MISKRKRTIVGKEQTESSLELFFAKNLHFLRAQNNEKQDVLADAIGISQSMISNYEKGILTWKAPYLHSSKRGPGMKSSAMDGMYILRKTMVHLWPYGRIK